LVVKDMEMDDIEFITSTLNCLSITNIEHFREEKVGHVDIMEDVIVGD
jgi:T-complex protein 1 subunit delta